MDLFSSRLRLVRPFEIAESHFFEVLLTSFKLYQKNRGMGTHLEVHFDKTTPAIWSRHAKHDIQRLIVNFEGRADDYQSRFDDILLRNKNVLYEYNDSTFPFRYASGGTLPIVRLGGRNYYCLFYRDIPPIGWNIANGACDNRDELLDPLIAVERELGEELMILDPKKKKRYVFEWDEQKRLDRPEFAVARRIWAEKFNRFNVPDFQELSIPLKWIKGPDSLTVHFQGDKTFSSEVDGCFLNINAADFGIEIDRIAKINVDEEAILCDGEMTEGCLLNRVVGLFAVDRFTLSDISDPKCFEPDIIFFNGKRWAKEQFHQKINEYLKGVASRRSQEELEAYCSVPDQLRFDLCPVTRQILLRFLLMQTKQVRHQSVTDKCNIFISHAGEDACHARKLYQLLDEHEVNGIFFCEEAARQVDYSTDIDNALDQAKSLIVIATDIHYLNKPWVQYEWKSFHNAYMNGRRTDTIRLIPLVDSEININDLPRPLCTYYEPISFDRENISKVWTDISRRIFNHEKQ